jgi:hypothetical protein
MSDPQGLLPLVSVRVVFKWEIVEMEVFRPSQHYVDQRLYQSKFCRLRTSASRAAPQTVIRPHLCRQMMI